MELIMTLQIRYECPECHQILSIDFQDFAPGKRQICTTCQTPGRITKTGLKHFSEEVRQFCQA